MTEPIVILGFLIYGAICYGIGYFIGIEQATDDTERRWSEAVERAEWHRKYGA